MGVNEGIQYPSLFVKRQKYLGGSSGQVEFENFSLKSLFGRHCASFSLEL
jgi:hypothetical protein